MISRIASWVITSPTFIRLKALINVAVSAEITKVGLVDFVITSMGMSLCCVVEWGGAMCRVVSGSAVE
jgi:hypothetical protein